MGDVETRSPPVPKSTPALLSFIIRAGAGPRRCSFRLRPCNLGFSSLLYGPRLRYPLFQRRGTASASLANQSQSVMTISASGTPEVKNVNPREVDYFS